MEWNRPGGFVLPGPARSAAEGAHPRRAAGAPPARLERSWTVGASGRADPSDKGTGALAAERVKRLRDLGDWLTFVRLARTCDTA